jgi:hypothetical protein
MFVTSLIGHSRAGAIRRIIAAELVWRASTRWFPPRWADRSMRGTP